MRAAIVTMDSAAMIVWLTPITMVRLAIGSCTWRSSWAGVDPMDSAASSVSRGTARMPCAVSRMTGGTAYTIVAMVAEAGPIRKTSVSGAR